MLIGRDVEQRRIDALLEHAKAGIGSLLALRGEPGIGKSALLRHAASRASGMTVLTATGAESESELPYAALAELLHPLLWLLPEIPDAQAAALAGALAVGPQPVAEPFTVYAGAHSLLATAAERQPVLMLVDDAHWLDSASRDAIFFAVRRLHADSVAVLFAVRDDSEFDVKRLGVDELTLTGLGNQDRSPGLAIKTAKNSYEHRPPTRCHLRWLASWRLGLWVIRLRSLRRSRF